MIRVVENNRMFCLAVKADFSRRPPTQMMFRGRKFLSSIGMGCSLKWRLRGEGPGDQGSK